MCNVLKVFNKFIIIISINVTSYDASLGITNISVPYHLKKHDIRPIPDSIRNNSLRSANCAILSKHRPERTE